jgi:hypothetical protein
VFRDVNVRRGLRLPRHLNFQEQSLLWVYDVRLIEREPDVELRVSVPWLPLHGVGVDEDEDEDGVGVGVDANVTVSIAISLR